MKICLCGSTRFKKEYLEWNKKLTLDGHLVYTVSMWSHNEDERVDPSPEQKTILDLVHLRKIMESDVIVVINGPDHYIGESTKREMQWAKILGKGIYYTHPTDNDMVEYARDLITGGL